MFTNIPVEHTVTIFKLRMLCWKHFKFLEMLRGLPKLLSNLVLGVLFPFVKQQGREADHSPLTDAKVKKSGAIALLPNVSSWHNN
jgi:hypothetical protein